MLILTSCYSHCHTSIKGRGETYLPPNLIQIPTLYPCTHSQCLNFSNARNSLLWPLHSGLELLAQLSQQSLPERLSQTPSLIQSPHYHSNSAFASAPPCHDLPCPRALNPILLMSSVKSAAVKKNEKSIMQLIQNSRLWFLRKWNLHCHFGKELAISQLSWDLATPVLRIYSRKLKI